MSSRPTDPTGPEALPTMPGTRREINKRGRAFGLEYRAGIRIMELPDPESEPPRPPLPGAGGFRSIGAPSVSRGEAGRP